MAVKKTEKGKVLMKHENFTLRQIPKFEGHGSNRKMVGLSIDIFWVKHNVKSGFKNPKSAIEFIDENKHKFDKKTRTFKD